MELTGWALVGMVIVLGVYLIPGLARDRRIMEQVHIEDRFSQRLRILNMGEGEQGCSKLGITGGSAPQLHPEIDTSRIRGVKMAVQKKAEIPAKNASLRTVRRPQGPLDKINSEIKAAKAQRLTAMSRRAAAAKRRIIMIGVIAAIGLLVGLLGLAQIISGLWILIPAAALAGVLALGRQAARSGAANDARARQSINELETKLDPRAALRTKSADPDGTRGKTSLSHNSIAEAKRKQAESQTESRKAALEAALAEFQTQSATESLATSRRMEIASTTSVAEAPKSVTKPESVEQPVAATELAAAQDSAPAAPAIAAAKPDPAAQPEAAAQPEETGPPEATSSENLSISAEIVEYEQVEELTISDDEPDRVWSPRNIPRPMYILKEKAPPRQIVLPEDAAVPQTSVRVPARPLKAEPAPTHAQSSREAASSARVVLEVEDMLEARRASAG